MWKRHVTIPDLRKKFDLIRMILPMRESFKVAEHSKAAFYRELWQASGAKTTSDEAIERKLQRYQKTDSVPQRLIDGLCAMFPTVRPDYLALPFREFERQLGDRAAKGRQFVEAATYYRSNRLKLTRWIRAYYGEAGSPFPVIHRKGWILGAPFELDPLPTHGLRAEEGLIAWDRTAGPAPTPPLLPNGLRLHELLRRHNPKLHNGTCYRLLEVAVRNGRPAMTFCLGRYFDYLDSCEILAVEAARAVLQSSASSVGADLPLRSSLGDVFDLRSRTAIPGVLTLVLLLNHSAGDVFLYHQRSDAVEEGPNSLHVVPAGSFEPSAADDSWHERDFSLRRNVLREFGEELLGKKTFQTYKERGEDFATDPMIRVISSLLDKRIAKLFFFGVGLDPITTQPEILTCLVLNMRDLLARIDLKDPFQNNYEGKYRTGSLTANQLEELAANESTMPGGAACMLLAARHLPTLLKGFR